MTLSEAQRSELWDRLEWLALTEESEGIRSDIATLLQCDAKAFLPELAQSDADCSLVGPNADLDGNILTD